MIIKHTLNPSAPENWEDEPKIISDASQQRRVNMIRVNGSRATLEVDENASHSDEIL